MIREARADLFRNGNEEAYVCCSVPVTAVSKSQDAPTASLSSAEIRETSLERSSQPEPP